MKPLFETAPTRLAPLHFALGANTGRLHGAETERKRVRENTPKLPSMVSLVGSESGVLCICGGGPSLKDQIKTIKGLKKKRKAKILSVNKVHDYLRGKAIIPDYHAVLDPMDWVAGYVKKPMAKKPKKTTTKYLIASQVHPDTIAALKHTDAYLWHCQSDYIEPEWLKQQYPNDSWVCCPNYSSTVAMRSIEVGATLGFTEMHLFGVDSSFGEEGEYSPFPKERYGDGHVQVHFDGKTFETNNDMARQANEFVEMVRLYDQSILDRIKQPFVIIVHGTGLVPAIARKLGMHADHNYFDAAKQLNH